MAAKMAEAAAELGLAVEMQTRTSDIVARVSSTYEASIGKNVLVSAVRDVQQTLAATKLWQFASWLGIAIYGLGYAVLGSAAETERAGHANAALQAA